MMIQSQVYKAVCALAVLISLGGTAMAQDTATPPAAVPSPVGVAIELNAVQDQAGACRLSFMAQNKAQIAIETAVYEAVLFDQAGEVMLLTLFDFRELPAGRPRVRQFDLAGVACADLGRVLINGASQCQSRGDGDLCEAGLGLSSRTEVELLG